MTLVAYMKRYKPGNPESLKKIIISIGKFSN